MAYQGSDYEPDLKLIGLVCLVAGFAALVAFRKPALPDPQSSAAYGCYEAYSAPSIKLGSEGMSIDQPGFSDIGFHLERQKTGIVLAAEAPIFAAQVDGRYAYGTSKRGVGWFMPFFKVMNGKRYGIFDEGDLSRFMMLAEDGVDLAYVKTAGIKCSWSK